MSAADDSPIDSSQESVESLISPSRAYEAYVDRLIALARSRLNKRYQAKVDPGDIVQSVFRTYVRRVADGKLESRNWESLWSLLARITVRKCMKQSRHFDRDKRDMNRELMWQENAPELSQLLSSEPTPVDAAMLEEEIDQLMQLLTPEQQRIVALKMQNYTNQEVAEIVGRAERTVYRIVRLVRHKLSEQVQVS